MLDRPRHVLRRALKGLPVGPAARSRTGVDPASPGSMGAAAPARRHQRATPPNVKGAGPLIAAPGLRLAVVVIVRDEATYIEEWLAYHRALGVGHFFIYDNGSDDGLDELLEPWVNHGLVTHIRWLLPGGQVDAYNHALRFFGPSVDWLAYFDVDEFLVPLVDDDIPSALARFPDAADVRVPRREFGFSGHRTRPETLVIEAYTGVADVFGRDPEKGARVKTVVQPRGVSAVGIHTATVADVPAVAPGDVPGRPVPTRSVRRGAEGIIQLNHYYTRSWDEFQAKRFRGSATGRIARPDLPFDLPTLEVDASALRFVERTRAMMERMRSLERSPYHYGSQLDLAQFPHSNDLGLFSEFAIANVAAGLVELKREPTIRIDNTFPGTGFVGDLASAGHVASAADISASVHMGALLDHIRGRLDGALGGPAEPGADPGTLEATDGGWLLRTAEGRADLVFDITHAGRRRCHAVGFHLAADAPLELRLRLELDERDGFAPRDPVTVRLEPSSTWAGIVELDDRPLLARRAMVEVRSGGADIRIHDLFLVSYG